jgi:plasminogen activator
MMDNSQFCGFIFLSFVKRIGGIIILFLLLMDFPAYSGEQIPLSISFEFQIGFVAGQTSEYVFENDKCISRLDWDENYSPYIKFDVQVLAWNYFISTAITSLIPDKSGSMQDYDFLNSGSTSPSHYSKHDAYLDKHIIVFAGTGYIFKIFNNLTLSPVVGIEYQNRKWTAQDGYLQYPVYGSVWTGAEQKQSVNGPVISYEQMFYYPHAGMEIIYMMNQMFDISCEGAYYPKIHVETIDNHFLRSVSFYDIMNNGFGYKVGIGLLFFPNRNVENLSYGLNFSYSYFSAMEGNTSSAAIGISDGTFNIDEGYSSGTKSDLWTVSLSVIMN